MKLTPIMAIMVLITACAGELYRPPQETAQQEQEQEQAATETPVVQSIVVDSHGEEPTVVVTTHALIQGTGCWANIFDEPNFRGRKLTVYNAIDLPSLEFTGTKSWKGRVESIELGPNTRAVIFEAENYLGGQLSSERGQDIASFQGIELTSVESLRLECALR
jgi:hypothetical protein